MVAQTVAQTQDTAIGIPPSKLIDANDVVTVLTFLVLKLAVAILPEGAVRHLCGWLARIHIMLRGSKAGDLAHVPELLQSDTDVRLLERQIVTRSYEELVHPLLERRRIG